MTTMRHKTPPVSKEVFFCFAFMLKEFALKVSQEVWIFVICSSLEEDCEPGKELNVMEELNVFPSNPAGV